MPPPVDPKSPASAFVEAAAASRLIDREVLLRLSAAAPSGATAKGFAAFLVGRGELTPFQAEKIGAGKTVGLAVGRYRVLCPIARGGMGIVYLARDTAAGPDDVARLVALKVLPPRRAAREPRTLARFEREMDIGLALPPHPHLVRTLNAGVSEGVHFLALEYVPGLNAKQLADRGTLTIERAARAFADVASGLHAAHAAGFLHRDVKPANIVVTTAGRGKLLDFGLAMKAGEAPVADPSIVGGRGYTLGTMDFLPPEQGTDAAAVTPVADIYSLGCSLYYALGGALPFPAGTAREKIRRHQTLPPTPLQQLNPTVPSEFVNVVEWMMAKNPRDRPASAAVVAATLEAWAAPARPVATLKPDADWERDTVREVGARRREYRTSRADGATSEAEGSSDGSGEDSILRHRRRILLVVAVALGAGVLFLAAAVGLVLLLVHRSR